MELLKEELEMVKVLRGSATGRALVSYVERLMNSLCDIRTMEGVGEVERLGRLEAVKILETSLVRLLKTENETSFGVDSYV